MHLYWSITSNIKRRYNTEIRDYELLGDKALAAWPWTTGNSMGKRCRIESVDFIPDNVEEPQAEQHPLLVSFARNTAPKQLEDVEAHFVDVGETGGKKLQFVCDDMEWRGAACETAMPADYFVAVYNKKRNSLQLIETTAQFSMRPKLPLESRSYNDNDDEEADNSKSVAQQRDDLLQMFGSRKAKRRNNAYRREQNQEVSAEKATTVAEAAIDLLKKNEDLEHRDADGDITSRPLAPPHNLEAENAADAYPLEHLMTPLEWEEISAKAEKAIAELDKIKSPTNPGWHPLPFMYLLNVVRAHDINAETRLKRVIACFYLQYLLAFIKGPRKISPSAMNRLHLKLDMSRDHYRCMIERFTTKQPGEENVLLIRTLGLDDRAIYYTVVVWMTIEGFRQCGHLGELAQALKITPKELAQFAQRVGAKLQRSKSTSAGDYSKFKVNLVVPLKFPEIAREKRKKRRKSRR